MKPWQSQNNHPSLWFAEAAFEPLARSLVHLAEAEGGDLKKARGHYRRQLSLSVAVAFSAIVGIFSGLPLISALSFVWIALISAHLPREVRMLMVIQRAMEIAAAAQPSGGDR